MSVYLTIRDMQKILPPSTPGYDELDDSTIRRYAQAARDEGKPIEWEGKKYWPVKAPGNGWQFKVEY